MRKTAVYRGVDRMDNTYSISHLKNYVEGLRDYIRDVNEVKTIKKEEVETIFDEIIIWESFLETYKYIIHESKNQ